MEENKAIEVLKSDTCYECSYGCDSPYNCESERCEVKSATRMAVSALERQEKYKWHDLRKNPEDLPEVLGGGYSEAVEVVDEENNYDIGVYGGNNRGFLGGLEGEFSWIEGTIIAWKYVEVFEEEESDDR